MPLVNSFAGASARGLGFGAAAEVIMPPFNIEYLVVSGGGAGGIGWPNRAGGGGGAGGALSNFPGPSPIPTQPILTVDASTPYPVVVGAGHSASTSGFDFLGGGSTSTFASITAGPGRSGGNAYRAEGADPSAPPYHPYGSTGGVCVDVPATTLTLSARAAGPSGNPGGSYATPAPVPYPTLMGGAGGGGIGGAGVGRTFPQPSAGSLGGSGGHVVGAFPTPDPTYIIPVSAGGQGAGLPGPAFPYNGVSGPANSGYGGNGGRPSGAPGGAGGSGFVVLRVPILYKATFTPGVTQHAGGRFGAQPPAYTTDASPSTSPTHRYYLITAAGPSDIVRFGAA